MSQDDYLGTVPTRLDSQTVKQLSQLNQFRSVGQVALEWLLIAAAITLCQSVVHSFLTVTAFGLVVYLVTVVWIATRQHALGILLHDAVHVRLCSNKALNDFVGEWVLAWPLQISLHGYRRQHFAHHRSVGEPDDPDYARVQGVKKYLFPKSRKELAGIFTKYLLGLYTPYDGKEAMEQLVVGLPATLQAKRIALYVLLIASAVYFDFWLELFLYWIIPSSTVLFLLLYIRLVAEHSALPRGSSVFTRTRHVNPTWWEKLLIAQNNVNYHLDHHLYPAVPFYNLPALHERLMQDPAYRTGARITNGYLSGLLLGECVRANNALGKPL